MNEIKVEFFSDAKDTKLNDNCVICDRVPRSKIYSY